MEGIRQSALEPGGNKITDGDKAFFLVSTSLSYKIHKCPVYDDRHHVVLYAIGASAQDSLGYGYLVASHLARK